MSEYIEESIDITSMKVAVVSGADVGESGKEVSQKYIMLISKKNIEKVAINGVATNHENIDTQQIITAHWFEQVLQVRTNSIDVQLP